MRPTSSWTLSSKKYGRPPHVSAVAVTAAFPHRFMIFRFAVSAAAGLLAAVVDLVDCRPRAPLRFVFRNAVLDVPFFDMLGLPLLFIRVLALVALRHDRLLSMQRITCKIGELYG